MKYWKLLSKNAWIVVAAVLIFSVLAGIWVGLREDAPWVTSTPTKFHPSTQFDLTRVQTAFEQQGYRFQNATVNGETALVGEKNGVQITLQHGWQPNASVFSSKLGEEMLSAIDLLARAANPAWVESGAYAEWSKNAWDGCGVEIEVTETTITPHTGLTFERACNSIGYRFSVFPTLIASQ